MGFHQFLKHHQDDADREEAAIAAMIERGKQRLNEKGKI